MAGPDESGPNLPAHAGSGPFPDAASMDPAMACRPRGPRGFSLVEVLVVVAVLAITSGIAVVAVRDVLQHPIPLYASLRLRAWH